MSVAMLRVFCSDNTEVLVERELLQKASRIIKKRVEALGISGSSAPDEEVPTLTMENVTAQALNKVMEYCVAHQRRLTDQGKRIADIAVWDERFVRLDPGALCELASAAYHLEIKPLVDVTCQAIAHLLKGKSPSEIRRTFNILYDFTPEDDVPPPTMRDKLRNKYITNKRSDGVEKVNNNGATLAAIMSGTMGSGNVDDDVDPTGTLVPPGGATVVRDNGANNNVANTNDAQQHEQQRQIFEQLQILEAEQQKLKEEERYQLQQQQQQHAALQEQQEALKKPKQDVLPDRRSQLSSSSGAGSSGGSSGSSNNNAADRRHPAVVPSVEEALQFINDDSKSSAGATPAKKKKKKNKRKKTRSQAAGAAEASAGASDTSAVVDDVVDEPDNAVASVPAASAATASADSGAAVKVDVKSDGLRTMDEDEETDVELDREVREFQRRLEASNQQQPRRKIALPANVTFGFRK